MNRACEKCKGACCEAMVLPMPWETLDPDVTRWLGFHGQPQLDSIVLDTPCSKLKDGACSIHSDRPNLCRDFKVGGDACRQAVRLFRPDDKAEIFGIISELTWQMESEQ